MTQGGLMYEASVGGQGLDLQTEVAPSQRSVTPGAFSAGDRGR
jgi:hypothetical protein